MTKRNLIRGGTTPVSQFGPGDHRHGTIHGYTTFKCRCDKCKRANANATYKRKYGITMNERDRMLMEDQGGKCPSCGRNVQEVKRWHIDHSHETGEVRAIICHNCNVSLGLMGEDPDRIAGLMRYAMEKGTRVQQGFD